MDLSRIGLNTGGDPFEGRAPRRTLGMESSGRTFADMVKNAISDVDLQHKTAEKQVDDIVSGKSENVHEAMISMQKASLSFQLMMEIRNKALETYQELSRMQM
jgi:flagellar hook-basal body complex protein FliE